MANPGLGFATGLLQSLTRNVQEDDKARQMRAVLQGDILGLSGEMEGAPAGIIPTTTTPQGGIPGMLSAFGVTKSQGPGIENLLMLRGMLQRRAKAEEEDRKNFHEVVLAIKEGVDLPPERQGQVLALVKNPIRRGILEGIFRQQSEKLKEERGKTAFRKQFGQELREGRPTAETGIGDQPIGRMPLSQGEIGAGFLELGEESTAATFFKPKQPVVKSFGKGGIFQYNPESEQVTIEREPEPSVTRTPMQEEVDRARAAYYNALAESPRGGVIFNEFLRQGGDPDDKGAFLEYAAERRRAGQQPPKPQPLETETLLREAAKYQTVQQVLDAIKAKKLTPEIGKQILKQKFGKKEKAKSATRSNPR